MDDIQKALVKAGRKDLAQEYYKKVAGADINATKEMLDSMDVAKLESEIKKRIGTSVRLKKELKNIRGRNLIYVESQNLADKAGILSSVMKEITIGTFNTSTFEEDGERVLWMTIHFSWSFKSGGTNGAELLTAWYNFDKKKWTFR